MKKREIEKKLISILDPYKTKLIIIFLCLILMSIMSLCIPLISKVIMDEGFLEKNHNIFIRCIIYLLLIYLSTFALEMIKEKIRIGIKIDIGVRLNKIVFKHIEKIYIQYLTDNNNAELLNRIDKDIETITSIADSQIFSSVTKFLNIIGGTIGLFIISPRLAIIILFFVPLKYLYIRCFKKIGKNIKIEYLKCNQSYIKWFAEYINGIEIIRLFNIQIEKEKEFNNEQKKVMECEKRLDLFEQFNFRIDSIVIQILVLIIYLICFSMLTDSKMSIGGVYAFVSYSSYVLGPIATIFNVNYFLSIVSVSLNRLYEFIELPEENSDNEIIDELRDMKVDRIEFRNVNFSYNEKPLLENLSLCINAQERIALVGNNGSGKTTIINLLLRFYNINSGEILLNGKSIYDLSVQSYRKLFSVVSQDIYLFNDSLKNNICLYKKMDIDKLNKIIKDSQLEEVVNEKSLEYMIGENGCKLSGGQRQKVALARALIQEAPICIYDEFTANIDNVSTEYIVKVLSKSYSGKILIIVSHDKFVQQFANRVINIT